MRDNPSSRIAKSRTIDVLTKLGSLSGKACINNILTHEATLSISLTKVVGHTDLVHNKPSKAKV